MPDASVPPPPPNEEVKPPLPSTFSSDLRQELGGSGYNRSGNYQGSNKITASTTSNAPAKNGGRTQEEFEFDESFKKWEQEFDKWN